MRRLFTAVRSLLIHDMSEDQFADMYAQTVSYGLLSASFSRPAGINAENLVQLTKITNPFLENLLESLFSLNRGKFHFDVDELGINDVLDLLRATNTEAIKAAFNDLNPAEDPVIRFYEGFLKAYDSEQRIKRGVFFTPRPVVSYIVRSVHELLQTEFGLEDGLASTATWANVAAQMERRRVLAQQEGSAAVPVFEIPNGLSPDEPFVLILDIATGTATFLNECIEVIERTMKTKWARELGKPDPESPNTWRDPEILVRWRDYVPDHLLPRLYGFEIMMAPYAIAHVKLALKLGETGYQFRDGDRLHIYLTNTLEPPSDIAGSKLADLFGPLAREAQEVNHVKRTKRFTVVIGNPPYSNFGQLNRIPFILNLLNDYKRGLDEKKINLDDDFIKFVRYSQHLLDSAGSGVLGVITNNAFYDGPTHRRMRQTLLEDFNLIRVINLHGSLKKGETTPEGGRDENVFDITVGVGISILAKSPSAQRMAAADLWGERSSKYERLVSLKQIAVSPLPALSPEFFFVPKDLSLACEYRVGPSIPEMFPLGISGIKTHRDELLVGYSKQQLVDRFQEIARRSDIAELKKELSIEDTAYWSLAHARRQIQGQAVPEKVRDYFYRPFDFRFVFYEPNIIERGDGRWSVMKHMLEHNVALVCTRQTNPTDFTEILVADKLVDKRALASFTGEARAYPLYVYEESLDFAPGRKGRGAGHPRRRRPNLSESFLKRLAGHLRLPPGGADGLPDSLTPEDIFHYAYAVFHSPNYRSRYAEFLKINFPRLPLTADLKVFRALARLGGELVGLHLLESPTLDKPITEYVGGRSPEVERVSWRMNTVWIDTGQTSGFKGVPEAVWHFHIGGYQVCEKWLKDRRGRQLSADDRTHYQRIVVALSETIRLMAEIDSVIDKHGGWPDAFTSGAHDSDGDSTT